MKLKITLLLIAVAGVIWWFYPRAIPASEAAKHVGQTCVIQGRVVQVHATRYGTVFLDFDAAYPNQTFTVVSVDKSISGAEMYKCNQHVVRVSGVVELYRGRPEIVIHTLQQISIL